MAFYAKHGPAKCAQPLNWIVYTGIHRPSLEHELVRYGAKALCVRRQSAAMMRYHNKKKRRKKKLVEVGVWCSPCHPPNLFIYPSSHPFDRRNHHRHYYVYANGGFRRPLILFFFILLFCVWVCVLRKDNKKRWNKVNTNNYRKGWNMELCRVPILKVPLMVERSRTSIQLLIWLFSIGISSIHYLATTNLSFELSFNFH